jgi:GT2 family glycosyltransferase
VAVYGGASPLADPPVTQGSIPLDRVSVLIVTHDRRELLALLLDSLRRIGGSRWARVVVVDDSTHPLSTQGRYDDLRLIHRVSPERLFISRAKNLGLRDIDSPFVLIIDDDNTLTESTLDRPLAQFAAEPRLGAIMPSVLYRADPSLVWVYATPFRSGRWGFELLGRNRGRDPALEGQMLPTDALPNAAFFRTEALRAVGGYDEEYQINSSADLCQRLKANGWRVCADSGAFVLHDVEPPGRPGYWAAHTVTDPERTYHEARDWVRFQYSVHRGESAVVPRMLLHSAGWVGPLVLALGIRRDAHSMRTVEALAHGFLDGLRSQPR